MDKRLVQFIREMAYICNTRALYVPKKILTMESCRKIQIPQLHLPEDFLCLRDQLKSACVFSDIELEMVHKIIDPRMIEFSGPHKLVLGKLTINYGTSCSALEDLNVTKYKEFVFIDKYLNARAHVLNMDNSAHLSFLDDNRMLAFRIDDNLRRK